MKNNAKLIISMLCIGLSATINGMRPMKSTLESQKLNGMREDLHDKLHVYNKAEAMEDGLTSKAGVTANWAKITAEPLSDSERIALAYECLSAPSNKNANAAWDLTRGASTLVGAAARGLGAQASKLGGAVARQPHRLYAWGSKQLASGTGVITKPIKSWVVEPVQTSWKQFQEWRNPTWENFETYLEKNQFTTNERNYSINTDWLNGAVQAAIQDLSSESFRKRIGVGTDINEQKIATKKHILEHVKSAITQKNLIQKHEQQWSKQIQTAMDSMDWQPYSV